MAQRNYFPIASDFPIRPFTQTKTKRTFSRGYSLNGVHHPRFMQIDVTLYVIERGPRTRQSCNREIAVGEIAGCELPGLGFHCADCIEPVDVQAFRVTWPLRRRTPRHPDGIRHELVVCSADQLNGYVQALRSATQRDVQAQEVSRVQ